MGLTLDEAIQHCKEIAEENEKFCYKKGGEGGYFNEDTDWDNTKCAAEHHQLAEWLKDYKRLLEKEPKTGHWIGHGKHCESLGVIPSGLGAYEWCSNCDCAIDVREWHRNNYNYCPNCGADMRGVKE